MKKTKKYKQVIVCTLLLVSCGETKNEEKEIYETDVEPWITRITIEESPFLPHDLEKAIKVLVEELNEEEQPNDIKLGILPKTTDGYFSVAILGANRAFGELGVIGTVHGGTTVMSPEELVEWQSTLMEKQLEAHYDGVGLAPLVGELVDEINVAVEEGMTVVTFDSDEIESKRHFYIGTGNYDAGKKAGETIDNIVEELGTVIVLGHNEEDWIDGYNRTSGARDALEAAGYNVVVVTANWQVPEENIAAMSDALVDADPKAVGMLGLFSNAYQCVDAAISAGMENQLKIATFDFEAETLAYMEDGLIQVTHGQRQYYMGYLIPYILVASKMFGVEETKSLLSDIVVSGDIIDTGLDIVEADELAEYNDFLISLGIL